MFSTVLVANRGEIACRIIDTLRRLGIRSVAVYSDADRAAKHVGLADVAVRIGDYLDVSAMLEVARSTGAEAIHPGYGFLSENAGFARECASAGIVFVGPSAEALEIMGDKITAKNHVAGFGVPLIPGIAEPGMSDERLIEAAAEVGYPLLVKPSAGGGGKGMMVVEAAAELPAALETSRRVALAGFGDDTLFLERLVQTPRHIEVQVLADAHGAVVHLGERECSLQRRHQKIVEEAPSVLLDDATRARIGEAACEVARSVGYAGAGTVEFLVSDSAPDEFFFMEMNTRLQVEHPVTELVTGIDLVEQQLRVASGEPLTLAQEDVALTGHAIEVRLYAENPSRGFVPATGTVISVHEPAGEGVRVDSALLEGLVVSSHYDPMLAKIVAWGSDRAEALARLDNALADTSVLGVHTNLEFLRMLLADEEVRAGHLDTGLVERMLEGIRFKEADDHVLAAVALHAHAKRWREGGPWDAPSGWRIGEHRPARYSFAVSATESRDVFVQGSPDAAIVRVGEGAAVPAGIVGNSVELGGITRTFSIAWDGDSVWLSEAGITWELQLRDRARQLAERRAAISRPAGAADPDIRTPMPGTVVAVSVTSGDAVAAGQLLLTVEAMKMEHKMLASVAGTVTIPVRPGDLVSLDQVVASIVPTASADRHNSTDPHEGAAA